MTLDRRSSPASGGICQGHDLFSYEYSPGKGAWATKHSFSFPRRQGSPVSNGICLWHDHPCNTNVNDELYFILQSRPVASATG